MFDFLLGLFVGDILFSSNNHPAGSESPWPKTPLGRARLSAALWFAIPILLLTFGISGATGAVSMVFGLSKWPDSDPSLVMLGQGFTAFGYLALLTGLLILPRCIGQARKTMRDYHEVFSMQE